MVFITQTVFYQLKKTPVRTGLSFFATSLPVDGVDWYMPIKYNITGEFIDLNIRKDNKDELYIRFKITKTLKCDFKDEKNCDLKYKVLTYDEDTRYFWRKTV